MVLAFHGCAFYDIQKAFYVPKAESGREYVKIWLNGAESSKVLRLPLYQYKFYLTIVKLSTLMKRSYHQQEFKYSFLTSKILL